MIGERLGKWVIFKEIGRGGMGRVFLAQDEMSGQHAALSGKLPVWLGIWQTNLLFGALGVIVIALQRRPSADPLAAKQLTGLRRKRALPAKEIGPSGRYVQRCCQVK